MDSLLIRPLEPFDFSNVRRIYQQGMDTGLATFETKAPNWEQWNEKFHGDIRIVALIQDVIVGWDATSPTSKREAYAGVQETCVYIDLNFTGQGIGTQLLSELIDLSEKNNIWTLQAVIFPENKASIQIHKNLGFREVGTRERIGKRDGKWRNTVLLEHRSERVGTD